MKKLIPLAITCLCTVHFLFAQNVGVGTTTPSAKLTVAGSDITPDGQAAGIKIQNTSSTNAWFLRAGATGTNTPVNGFSIADNLGYHFNMALGGNIGLGILPTAAKLHVNGEIRMQGLNIFEFGAGVAGKEPNAGKIGYNAFGQNALTFVGGGTTSSNRAVYIYAEGGTTMNGPLNIGGGLSVNGNSGTAGQVLTSNGNGTSNWENTALSNNVRFAASFTTPATFPYTNSYTSIYNTSGADVSIATNTITINKSGLYHIEGYATGDITFSVVASYFSFSFNLITDGIEFQFSTVEEMLRNGSPLIFTKTIHFSQDVYLTAPAIIMPQAAVSVGSGGTGVSRSAAGKITGYLISE